MSNSWQNMTVPKRSEWEANHVLIRDAFLRLLEKRKGRKPTFAEIAEETGLGERTIYRHVEALEFKPQITSWRVMTGDVIAALWRKCMKGDSNAIKLWLQVVEGVSERSPVSENSGGPDYAAALKEALHATAGGNVPPGASGVVQQPGTV